MMQDHLCEVAADANISVALCTCNGARFLAEQLESIAAQTRPPDELVICDDQSGDATVGIVRRFAGNAPFDVRLRENPRRLGPTANFAQAIALCRGRVILLADQDDLWLPDKVRRMAEALTSGATGRSSASAVSGPGGQTTRGGPGGRGGRAVSPPPALAFSDAVLVDEHRKPLGRTLWQALRLRSRQQQRMAGGQAFHVLLKRNLVTGAALALRSEHRELLLPIPSGWMHDAWIALLLSAVASCVPIAEPLFEYRQHERQQIGESKSGLYQQYLRGKRQSGPVLEAIADNYAAARQRLLQVRDGLPDAAVLTALQNKVDHYRAKARMRSTAAWRWPIIAQELLARRYVKYSQGWRSLAQDLFL